MQDLITKILAFLPQYLMDFGAVFVSPKQFVATKNTNPKENFQPALIFGAVSAALMTFMTLPVVPPGRDIWTLAGTIGLLELLAVTLSAAALRFAWFVVGGRGKFGGFFITYAYYFGVVLVLLAAVKLLSVGVFRVFAPDLYLQEYNAMVKGAPWPDLSKSFAAGFAVLIYEAGMAGLMVWGFFGWGAYRILNNLSKKRSAIAGLIWTVLGLAIAVIVYILGTAMRPV